MIDLRLCGETGDALVALGVVVAHVRDVRARTLSRRSRRPSPARPFMLVAGHPALRHRARGAVEPRPWTIPAMFLIMGGLVRTGALDWLTRQAEAQADHRPLVTLSILFGFVAAASAIMNNTPVVVVMIPVFIQVAQQAGSRAVEAADPAQLRRDPRRHAHADRHLDQPARRRGGAVEGDGALRHLRDHCRSACCRCVIGLAYIALIGAAPAARPAVHEPAAVRPAQAEVLHRGRGARRTRP